MMNKKIIENFPYQGVIIQNFFRFGGSYLYNSFIESNKTLINEIEEPNTIEIGKNINKA